MSGKRSEALGQRIALWKAGLWQVYEGQFEPVTPAAVVRYLRGIRAWVRWSGLEALDRTLDDLVEALGRPVPPAQPEVEQRIHALLADLEVACEGVEDPPTLAAHAVHLEAGPEFLTSSLDITLVFEDLAKLGSLEVFPDITACPPLGTV
jgi:hypothetical protein